MQSKAKKAILTAGLLAAAAWTGTIGAQEAEAANAVPSMLDRLGISQSVETYIPGLDGAQSPVSWTLGGTFQLAYAIFPQVDLLGRVGVQSLQMRTNQSLWYVGGSAGVGYSLRLGDRFSLRASAFGGLGQIPDTNTTDNEITSYGMYEIGARLVADMRVSSAFILGLSVGYQRLATPSLDFIDALSTGIVLRLLPSELGDDGASVTLVNIDTQTIFPVLRSWYGNEPLGSVEIRNDEDGPIRDIKVSFYAPEYMGSPRVGGEIPLLLPGETATVPLYAIFDERVLQLTQNVSTSGEIAVEYNFYGSRRIHSEAINVRLHHRNAMTWEDDRKAAAFVSPTDPAALWFSRYASSIVRDRMRADLPSNLQYALGIFEALRLYGVNYVIDPNSAYVEMASNAASVDYLQYPGETLMYRGGDCDDLSILFCSLLESAGISTAFITIPGHIYMAFDVGISEQQATEQFFDPGLLFIKDGKVWAPIEITMVREGFVKAWRIGAKQWLDNNASGTADLFPMRSNWQRYPSTGIQDAAARFELPAESDSMVAFDDAVDRFIIRELGPSMQQYETALITDRSPEVLNAYGIVLAKAGLLDQAWERFTEAAELEYGWAWNNLANIAFARKDYELAYSYYDWAESLLPEDPVAVMGKARAAYELDRYSESAVLYASITDSAPLLTDRFAYLASVFTGTGRAFSLADRLSGTIWSQPGLSFLRPKEPEAEPALAAAPALTETPEADLPEEIITEPAALVLVPAPAETEATLPESEPEPAAIIAAPLPEIESEPVAAITAPLPSEILEPIPETVDTIAEAPETAIPAITEPADPEPVELVQEPLLLTENETVEPETEQTAAELVSEPNAENEELAAAQSDEIIASAEILEPEEEKPAITTETPATPDLPAETLQPPIPAVSTAPAIPAISQPGTTQAQAQPETARIRSAPPAIVEKPPEDSDIASASARQAAEKAASAPIPPPANSAAESAPISLPTVQQQTVQAPITVAPTLPQPPATPSAPPQIIQTAPADRETAAAISRGQAEQAEKTEQQAELAIQAPALPSVAEQPQAIILPQAIVTPPAVPTPSETSRATETPALPVVPAANEEAALIVDPAPAETTIPEAASLIPDTIAELPETNATPTVEPAPAADTIANIITTPAEVETEVATQTEPEQAELITETTQPVQSQATVSTSRQFSETPLNFPWTSKTAPALITTPLRTPYMIPLRPGMRPLQPEIDHSIATAAETAAAEAENAKTENVQAEPSIAYINFNNTETRTGSGTWEIEEADAAMTDSRARYAKLVIPPPLSSGPVTYEFTANSTGSGFTGLGLHIHGQGDWMLKFYGGGRSLLIWLTYDPAYYKDESTRLQLYESYDEVNMKMLQSVAIEGSIFDSHSYRIDYDPDQGVIKVYIDDTLYLQQTGLANPDGFNYAALRSLNQARFSNLSIRPMTESSTLPEDSDDQ